MSKAEHGVMNYVVVSDRTWVTSAFVRWEKEFPGKWHLITDPQEFTPGRVKRLQPRYLFFPHWSHILDREIYENFECVMFHMTDLPFGRGGSPLQNLLSRGISETKMSAFRCSGVVDGGPIYLKRPFTLEGSAGEIYVRGTEIIGGMIRHIVDNMPEPSEQQGLPVVFTRRKPDDGDISNLATLDIIYDFIRMLDAEGYPPAFMENDRIRLEFSNASLKNGAVHADVTITMKK